MNFRKVYIIFFISILISSSCKKEYLDNIKIINRRPMINPDYSGITIPYNIAPLNFDIQEESNYFLIKAISENGDEFLIKSKNGSVRFKMKQWKKLLKQNSGGKIKLEVYSENKDGLINKFEPIFMEVKDAPIDPYICYRLLYPGFEAGGKMELIQRSLENFHESSVIENQLLEKNCINCHTFKQNNPEKFFIHVRGSKKGTYIVENNKVKRMELRVGDMSSNAVYPTWHPSGQYIIFSSNKIVQAFHMGPEKRNEIYDLESSLYLYSVDNNTMRPSAAEDTCSSKYMETFPCWSPDGNYLYYCRTLQLKSNFDYKNITYDLVRRHFDSTTGNFGQCEVVFNTSEIHKSVTVPSISPDGNYLIFALNDYGTSSIWHKNADLYLLNLLTGEVNKMNLNSDEAESYQSWSSNGRWIIFSSKRRDGLTARPYIAYFSKGEVGKPFILPQKDPAVYDKMIETFNLPEFVTGKIKVGPRDFARASKQSPTDANWEKVVNDPGLN